MLIAPNVPAVVHEFAKNHREVVRTSLQEYHGRRVIDLRVWLPRSSDGVLVPAPKGLTVDQSLLPELEKGLAAARTALSTSPSAGDPTR